MKHNTKQRGFTLIELLVVMSIIALLLSILMPALGRARAEALLTKDQTQIKGIFSGFSFWSPSHDGLYPTPGLEARLAGSTGQLIKGRGPENLAENDHAAMLSMCVMQGLFSTDVLFAPTEQGDFVYPMEAYDYNVYEPGPSGSSWSLWDEELVNDLEVGSNNSYGIMPLTGKRKQQNWTVNARNPASFAVVGTRGPVDGEPDPYSRSNLLHGIERDWKGPVNYGDGHNEVLDTFYPISSTYINDNGVAEADNLFLEEENQAVDNDYMPGGLDTGQGADIILTHVRRGDAQDDGSKGGSVAEFIHD